MKPLTKHDKMLLDAIEYLAKYKYAYGAKRTTGVLTESKLNTLASNSPAMYTAAYKSATAKHIGEHVIDCSGLVCALWEIPDIGSTQISNLPTKHILDYERVPIIRSKLKWGDALWKDGHVGMYLGDGYVIEAKGVKEGVRISRLEDTAWCRAIRKCDLHKYERIGWCLDDIGWWYAYGESDGEFYKKCTLRPDAVSKYWTFDKDGYSSRYVKEDKYNGI